MKCMIVFCVPEISNDARQYILSGEEDNDQRQKEKQIIIAAKMVDKLILLTMQVKLYLCVLVIGKGERLQENILVGPYPPLSAPKGSDDAVIPAQSE